MSSECKLRCSVIGHEQDVRALAPLHFPEGGFVSGSRDVTARVWVPNEEDNAFREGLVLGGHNGFVSAVCALPPDDEYPQGLIMTGSNDHNIHAYSLESPEPRYRLMGHSDNVCALAAGKFGSLISGSWDKTARVWLKQKCVMTLQEHEAAIWGVAIMPEGGFMITASADKTLKLWKAGKCERTYRGHTDCVRGVAILNATEFLSCSNDATIRLWSVFDGACLQIFHGHTSFIYAIAVLPVMDGGGVNFVSCGEDRTLRVWRGSELRQTVFHPAQSIWAVCVLPNGDIATGASDGIVRVFTTCSNRLASAIELQDFEQSLAGSEIPAQIGDINTEDLVGPSALLNPGRRDGQTLMVRQEKCIEAYQWSVDEARWIKVGNVVGGSSDNQSQSGNAGSGQKTQFEGKEYDYVFNVEIYEDKPPLKLPYNISDDPWVAAHNFLETNNISQMFLDQVANFIQSQTAGITLGVAAGPVATDPFTGGSRYVPRGSRGDGAGAVSRPSTDPFTGSNRYVPQGVVAPPQTGGSAALVNETHFFPETTFIKFEHCNVAPLFAKLREFNVQVDISQRFSDSDLRSLEELVGLRERPADIAQLEMLWRMMQQWPAGMLFPVLDIFRLVVRDASANEHYCSPTKFGPHLVGYACSMLGGAAASVAVQPKNLLLMLRALCNSFQCSSGERLMLENGERLLAAAKMALLAGADKLVEVALGSFLLNLSIGYRRVSKADGQRHCLLVAADLTQFIADAEAQFRLLVAMGTLIAGNSELRELARSLDVVGHFVGACESAAAAPDKVKACARQLRVALGC